MTAFGHRSTKRKEKMRYRLGSGWCLYKQRILHNAEEKPHEDVENPGICKLRTKPVGPALLDFKRDGPQTQPTLLDLWSQTLSLHDCKAINFCCLRPLTCGASLQQTQRNTSWLHTQPVLTTTSVSSHIYGCLTCSVIIIWQKRRKYLISTLRNHSGGKKLTWLFLESGFSVFLLFLFFCLSPFSFLWELPLASGCLRCFPGSAHPHGEPSFRCSLVLGLQSLPPP